MLSIESLTKLDIFVYTFFSTLIITICLNENLNDSKQEFTFNTLIKHEELHESKLFITLVTVLQSLCIAAIIFRKRNGMIVKD